MWLLSSSEFQKYLNHMFEIIEVQAYLVQMSMSEAQAKEGALWNSWICVFLCIFFTLYSRGFSRVLWLDWALDSTWRKFWDPQELSHIPFQVQRRNDCFCFVFKSALAPFYCCNRFFDIDCRERKEGRERSIMHSLVDFFFMCSDWGSNPKPWCIKTTF